MTQKEKAQAYDEALKVAQCWLNAPQAIEDFGYTVEDAIQNIFPQLRESEDERIRKYLIEELKAAKSVGELKFVIPQPTREECIAYLEKQKEQKPILEVFGFKVGDTVRLKDGDGRKHIIKSFEEVEGLHGPNFYYVEFEDNSARSGIYTGEEYPKGYYTQMEKFKDEQKPAEWSEEDERILKGIIGKIDHDQTYGVSKVEMLSFLKSIRSHWKPTKEQMDALEEMIVLLRNLRRNIDDRKNLETLREQLEKL